MGTPGVPLNIPRERIVQSIKKKKGIVTQICADLDIDYHTYQKHIRDDPELKAMLDRARHDYKETICDMAETAIMRAINQKDDLNVAAKYSQYVLNNMGQDRGYNHPEASQIKISPAEVVELARKGLLKQPD